MIYLDKKYLEDISKEIFPGNAPPEIQRELFMQRFNSNNYPCTSIEIARSLNEQYDNPRYVDHLQPNIKEIIKKIYRTFEDELVVDGIDQEQLGLTGAGRRGRRETTIRSPWQVAFDWLWEKKYYRWSENYIWETWSKEAQKNSTWMEFRELTTECSAKAMNVPLANPIATLPKDTPLGLQINLEQSDGYLLLFNRGQNRAGKIQTRYLVAPSRAYAPKHQLVDNSLKMPQEDAACPDISFDAEGKEEYLGIVVDHSLDLPWLTTNTEEYALEWEGVHLEELWNQLHGKESWQMFYCDFEVVA